MFRYVKLYLLYVRGGVCVFWPQTYICAAAAAAAARGGGVFKLHGLANQIDHEKEK